MGLLKRGAALVTIFINIDNVGEFNQRVTSQFFPDLWNMILWLTLRIEREVLASRRRRRRVEHGIILLLLVSSPGFTMLNSLRFSKCRVF